MLKRLHKISDICCINDLTSHDLQYDSIKRDIPQVAVKTKETFDYPHEEIEKMSGY